MQIRSLLALAPGESASKGCAAMSRISQIRVVSSPCCRTTAGRNPCSTAYSFIALGAITTRRRSRVGKRIAEQIHAARSSPPTD